MRITASLSIFVLVPTLAVACSSDSGGDGDGESAGDSQGDSGSTGGDPPPRLPNVDDAMFVEVIDNPYFPMPVGATWVIEAQTDEGVERIEIEVLAETRTIEGVVATVVRDTVTLNDEIIEDTWDWFAQDTVGNVWYLGEDTCEFENGMCVAMVGAWEWGVEGALPGIVMLADPQVGAEAYYQEYKLGEAEDVGEVVEVGVSVTVPAGTFDDCVKTHDTSTLDPMLDEFKYYCRDVGTVLIEEADIREELIEYQIP